MQYSVHFQSSSVNYIHTSVSNYLRQLELDFDCFYITDANVYAAHNYLFVPEKTIVVSAGEESKSIEVLAEVSSKLLALGAGRSSLLIAVGGGVITDLAGFIASVFMRGMRFGFVPTSLLAMVDAAIGGKNGINLLPYKNILGVIKQPEFILFDSTMLSTLPNQEWSNGFAEVIKYACIFDADLFGTLERHSLDDFMNNSKLLAEIIKTCVDWKNKTVLEDEDEKGIRKLLNFGHTLGHAIEHDKKLPHGFAVSIGMMFAVSLSVRSSGLSTSIINRLSLMLSNYGLPSKIEIHVDNVMTVLKADKKRSKNTVSYILLKNIGDGYIHEMAFEDVEKEIKLWLQG